MMVITSPANPRIRELERLQTARGRKKSGFFIMEGPHLLEVLLDAQVSPYEVYYQPTLLRHTVEGTRLLERLVHTAGLSLFEVSEKVIETISEVQTSQGLVCVLSMDAFAADKVRKRRTAGRRPAMLILDSLADPGNMGTILRTALAADVEKVLLTPNCVDYFSPKVVRAAAGAHIALPVEIDIPWKAIAEKIEEHCYQSPRVFLAEAGSSHFYYDQDLTQPFALIIGNEAHGPSPNARQLSSLTVTIPLANGVESLNAGMATGIILYEAVRQLHALS